MKKYSVRCRENGDTIDNFNTYKQAVKAIKNYEKEDGESVNFYEIYNNTTKKIED